MVSTATLHLACMLGLADEVQLLVEHADLDPNVQNGDGETAIYIWLPAKDM